MSGSTRRVGLAVALGAVALGTRASHAVDQLETRTGLDLALVDGAPQALVCQLV